MRLIRYVAFLCLVFTAAGAGAAPAAAAADPARYDVVVYGGTSGGIAAAIQSARMGKTAVLIEPTQHLGGLTTGGLGATDIGNKRAIGGIAREFYGRIWQHYNDPANWKHETRDAYFASRRRAGNDPNEKTMWTFEPHVATKVYDDMLEAAGDKVAIVRGERLDLKNGVVKDAARITRIVMESGRAFEGAVFIDATYEGDLMAKAGVKYHVGREANSVYGETLNGVQTGRARAHQFTHKVDPYVKPGDPASGLLPGIEREPGEEFAGDRKVQAYNFRMCTTDVPENRRPWPKPANYDPQWFELLLRNFDAGDKRVPWNPVWMPNRKTDTNNNFAISTDFIGQNWDYPEADHATREKIWQAHKDWQMGLMWTLANHPRVPAEIREEFNRLGLAKDEFTETPDNWPRQLYVREARRMIGDYVMTEKNCKRQEIVPDSVGMGAYNMDSHNIQRYVTEEGFVRNEGDIQVGSRPYPISYRSIRPREAECSNLLVPVCLSASHIAYGSIRMEPVFMVLGQSAATAAAMAIDAGTSVQSLDYAKLQAKLLTDAQVLDFESPAAPEQRAVTKASVGGIVVDDEEAQVNGFDTHSTSHDRYVAHGYRHDGNGDKGKQTARFTPDLPADGKYEVFIAYPNNPNRADKVPVTVRHADGVTKVTINQKKKPAVDGLRQTAGVYRFEKGRGGSVEISNEGTDGYVVIDAVQWVAVKP